MKKFLSVLCFTGLLTILLVGCNNTKDAKTNTKDTKNISTNENISEDTKSKENISDSKSGITIDVKNMDDTKSTFSLEMTKDDVIKKLRELNIKTNSEIEITSNKDDPEFGDKVLITDNIHFTFDKSNKLCSIEFLNKVPDSLGIELGDSIEKIEEIYGKDYKSYKLDNDWIAYEYTFDSYYFDVFTENNKTVSFRVSKYSSNH